MKKQNLAFPAENKQKRTNSADPLNRWFRVRPPTNPVFIRVSGVERSKTVANSRWLVERTVRISATDFGGEYLTPEAGWSPNPADGEVFASFEEARDQAAIWSDRAFPVALDADSIPDAPLMIGNSTVRAWA
jgi:hypothetical protein